MSYATMTDDETRTLLSLTASSARFEDLVFQQEAMMADGESPCPVPLIWVAMAENIGLSVDLATGQIVDGPKLSPFGRSKRSGPVAGSEQGQ